MRRKSPHRPFLRPDRVVNGGSRSVAIPDDEIAEDAERGISLIVRAAPGDGDTDLEVGVDGERAVAKCVFRIPDLHLADLTE